MIYELLLLFMIFDLQFDNLPFTIYESSFLIFRIVGIGLIEEVVIGVLLHM